MPVMPVNLGNFEESLSAITVNFEESMPVNLGFFVTAGFFIAHSLEVVHAGSSCHPGRGGLFMEVATRVEGGPLATLEVVHGS